MSEKLQPIALDSPVADSNVTLIEALRRRRSNRDFDSAPVSQEHLSGIMWAAYGANRPY